MSSSKFDICNSLCEGYMNAVTFAAKPAFAHHCAFSVQPRVVDPTADDAFKVHRIAMQLTFTFMVNKY